ncbi:MAG: FHA domain-containing protein [Sphingomonas sp.]
MIRGDPTVGRHHAELSLSAKGQALLTDRKSSAGTAVKRDGRWQAISTLALTPNVQLRFGGVEISAARLIALAQEPPGPDAGTVGAGAHLISFGATR